MPARVDSGSSEKVESENCLLDESAPQVGREIHICAIENGDEVSFEVLNGSFCKVPSVHAGVNELVVQISGFDACCQIL